MVEASPREAVGEIAGWENAVATELQGGCSNRTWLLTSGDRRAVLKLDDSPRHSPFNTRAAEQRVQTAAAGASIAMPVIYVSERAYLTEYAVGNVWSVGDLDSKENLARLAALLRKLHALPPTGRRFSAVDAARHYARTIGPNASRLLRQCLEIVTDRHEVSSICCCHNDLVVGNIVATPGLRLLDWEYACDNDPLFDLATVVAHHELSFESSAYLLDCYFDGDGPRWQARLEQQMRLYNALAWLWYASRPEVDPAQLAVFESRLQ